MAQTAAPSQADLEEQLSRIRRMNTETQKFVEEGAKLAAESRKLYAEQQKLERDRALAPWQIAATSAVAGAALVGSGIALAKLFLP